MATFKVGQRVRKVCKSRSQMDGVPIGFSGTVRGHAEHKGEARVLVEFDNYEPDHDVSKFGPYCWPAAYQLVPLTDLGADAFIERIKKLKPYDEPVVTKLAPMEILERLFK